eukprot:gene22364-biopygen22240
MIGKIELFGRTPCICRGGGLRWPDAGGPPVSSPLPPLPEPLRPVGGGVGPPRVSGITGVRFRRRRPAAGACTFAGRVICRDPEGTRALITKHPASHGCWSVGYDCPILGGLVGICRRPVERIMYFSKKHGGNETRPVEVRRCVRQDRKRRFRHTELKPPALERVPGAWGGPTGRFLAHTGTKCLTFIEQHAKQIL